MTKKIFRSVFLVAVSVLAASILIIVGILHGYYNEIQESNLKTELALAASGVETNGVAYLKSVSESSCRLTLIATDGRVIYDTQAEAGEMENHSDREEFSEAIESGSGQSVRFSQTLVRETVYLAVRIDDGSVLRISDSRVTIFALFLSMLQPIAAILVLALIFSALLADRLSKRIVKPLEELNLESPLENDVYDELAPMLTRLEHLHRQIRFQREELEARKKEFSTVTASMKEGLVLLNEKGIILSTNPAARTFFGKQEDYSGEDFLVLERDSEISRMIADTFASGSGELQLSRGGREYLLTASRVGEEKAPSGVVLLIVDDTEKVFAERNRREFTANVSHELKTPLQSIMGSAELMENGLVKKEDIPVFTGRIRSEAARLVSLIDDIIRLSQLDENTRLTVETVDLYNVASEELAALGLAADDKHVTLSLDGETTLIPGVRQLVHDIVYNLVDNAIKYNIDGGRVEVCVTKGDGCAVLTVRDNGIGIPAEAQSRIFERFYRVDKSHHKQINGTGLGLSIVKHAVQYHHGTIAVESKPGEGTTVTVTFPLEKTDKS